MSLKQKLVIVLLALSNLLVLPVVGFLLLADLVEARNSAAPTASTSPISAVPRGTEVTVAQTRTPVPSPTLTAVPAANILPSGWTRFQAAAGAITIALPPSWQRLEIDRARLEANLARIKATNPPLAEELLKQSREILNDDFLFFAFDTTASSAAPSFMTNVNLVYSNAALPVSLDAYAEYSYRELTALSSVSGPVSRRRIRLEAGEAEEFRFTQDVSTGSTPAMTSTVQYVFVRDRHSYILTLTSPETQARDYAPIFEAIAFSLTWNSP